MLLLRKKMVPPAGLEPASLSCHLGGTVGLGIRPTESHRLRSTNSGSAAGRGKVPAGTWQAYLLRPIRQSPPREAMPFPNALRQVPRKDMMFYVCASPALAFTESEGTFRPWPTWTACGDSICKEYHPRPLTRCVIRPRLEPLKGLEPYNMESGTDLCHPLDMRLLLRTALYPTQRRTPRRI